MSFHKDSKNITDEKLYTELFMPLFKYVYFRTKDYNLATDLTQSAFLKFLKLDQKPVNWGHSLRLMFTIVRNLLIDHWRTEARHKVESLEEVKFQIKSEEATPDKIFAENEDVALIKNLLQSLTDTEEEIVTMRITSEISYREIGEVLDLTSENARKIYSRALNKIKKLVLENKDIYNYD